MGLKAVEFSSTRTAETEARYRQRFKDLLFRAECETGIVPFGPPEFVTWFLAAMRRWSPATIRLYRAAAIFALEEMQRITLEKGAGHKADSIAPALERLRLVDQRTGRGAGPEPCDRTRRRTSAGKRKTLSPAQAAAVADPLNDLGHKHVALARGFMRFGPDLGVRPVEWQTATVGNGFLAVQNAKHTNDRACGPARWLDLRAYPATYLVDLQAFLDAIRAAVAKDGEWERVAEGIGRALRAASFVAGAAFPSLRRSPVTLYTLRHVAAARMKLVADRVSVAAMLGHASDETASSHYARASSARGWRPILTKASEQNVMRVRAVYVPLEKRRLGSAARSARGPAEEPLISPAGRA